MNDETMYRKNKSSEVKKIAGWIVALLVVFQGATLLYAEDEQKQGDAAAQVLPGKVINENVTEDASGIHSQAHPYSRKEKVEKWLEAHPKAKKRINRNQDGTVDKKESKHARQLRRHHHRQRRDYDNNPPGALGGPGASPNRRGGRFGKARGWRRR